VLVSFSRPFGDPATFPGIWYWRPISPGIKQLEHDVNYSLSYSAEAKSAWSFAIFNCEHGNTPALNFRKSGYLNTAPSSFVSLFQRQRVVLPRKHWRTLWELSTTNMDNTCSNMTASAIDTWISDISVFLATQITLAQVAIAPEGRWREMTLEREGRTKR
jgi:hypothetical protein